MRTDFSEFSFGYALVEEFARSLRPGLQAAPVFPSLIEEGRDGGGYDVKFDHPGIPLLIQFKRPDVMKTTKSKEISDHNLPLLIPFYRFHIRSSATSRQHDMLLAHDNGNNLVYYASPCFHEIANFDRYYLKQTVINNTIFVRPCDIGPLSAEPHHISYDQIGIGWRFSDKPVQLESITRGRLLEDDIEAKLLNEKQALGEGILTDTIKLIEKNFAQEGLRAVRPNPRIGALDNPWRDLARLSELSQIYLNAQLFIVQRTFF